MWGVRAPDSEVVPAAEVQTAFGHAPNVTAILARLRHPYAGRARPVTASASLLILAFGTFGAAGAVPSLAAAASGGGAFVQHISRGWTTVFTPQREAAARPLTGPAGPSPAETAQSLGSSASQPSVSNSGGFNWSPASWLGAPWSEPQARPAYSGPQHAFPIFNEGYLKGADYDPAVGRLYAQVSRTVLGECTATVVARSVVLTAGHCVMNTHNHHFYSHFLFVPGLHGKKAPLGAWKGHSVFVLKALTRHFAVSVDYAFLSIRPSHHHRIGKLTGWPALLANSRSKKILSMGYPASGVFAAHCQTNSCVVWACFSPVARKVRDHNGFSEVGMGCHSGEGSSGGPWFERYHGRAYIASNVSTGITFEPDPGYCTNQWGPYYNRDTLKLLKFANRHA